jgi:putative peptide zinc metalloprotease protein
VNPRPKLRRDLVLVEQTYRGEQSYILKDPESRKYYRFGPVEVRVMQALDGERTTAEAADALAAGGLRVSNAVVEKFALKLTAMGLCERTVGERSVLLMERLRAERRRRLGPTLFKGDILRMRWSVGDPDKLLDRWLPSLRFFFSPAFVAISVVLFALYFLIIAVKWPEFSQAVAAIYTFQLDLKTLALFWVTGAIIIIIHELGHAFTCKYFGGQVHEIGAMLIYFEPAFFCNVNDAWTFPELKARLWVTAAGSWIQLVLASVAAIVWWAAAPGTVVSEVAFATVLIGGITTVLMNLNPLIPLDGYYALSDYLEVPNLRQRAFAHLSWWIKTRVFRLEAAKPPADEREERIFLVYAGLSIVYIAMLLGFVAINLFGWLEGALGFMGTLIFLVGVWLALRPRLQGWRQTARVVLQRHGPQWKTWHVKRVLAGVVILVLLGLLVPWPISISGRFVVAPAATIPLVAADSGIVDRVLVREGTRVPAGAPLLKLRNLELERQVVASQRVTDSLMRRSRQARARDLAAEVARLDAARETEEATLAGLSERMAALDLRALGSGVVVTRRPEELAGRWVSRGELLLVLERPDSQELRIALTGAGATLVRAGQPVLLLSDGLTDPPVRAQVTDVSAAGGSGKALEARVRLTGEPWRPGMTGRARIRLRSDNLWGALWWEIRRGIRSDILL